MEGNDNTIERGFNAFKSIEDNYPKYVISLDRKDLENYLKKDGMNLNDYDSISTSTMKRFAIKK